MTLTKPQAYVVMHGNPATGFAIHGTWANANDAGDWADQNLAREYDYWVMPMTISQEVQLTLVYINQ
jgi:hypothetical protein